jgi:hypothetical protein
MTTSDASDQPIVHMPGQWKSPFVESMRQPWSCSRQSGTPGHCFVAQVWDVDGNSIACMDATTDEELATSRARLMAAAPQLLQSLLHAMTLLKVAGYELNGTATDKMKQAIECATGQPYKVM